MEFILYKADNYENHGLLCSECGTMIKRGDIDKIEKYAKERGIEYTVEVKHFIP